MTEKSIGILYICTGPYVAFWEGFFRSAEQFFLPETRKEYYVFTDAERIAGEDDPRVHRIPQEDLGWPGNTIYRFRVFLSIEEELRKRDYLCFLNANVVFLQTVTEEEFLPSSEEGLVVTRHPGHIWLPTWQYAYERRKESTACIPYFSLRGTVYVCGGVNGGTTEAFLAMAREMDARIAKDDRNGITAIWHDESHLNRYVADLNKYKLLTPAYAYPEDKELPHEQKILLLEKRKYIPLSESKRQTQFQKPPGFIQRQGLRLLELLKRRRKCP